MKKDISRYKRFGAMFVIVVVVVMSSFLLISNRIADKRSVEAVRRLRSSELSEVSKAVLDIWKLKLRASDGIEYLIPLLSDNRIVPREVISNTKYYETLEGEGDGQLGGGHADKEFTLGNCAASALVAIGSMDSSSIFYNDSSQHVRARKRIVDGVIPLLKKGSATEKLNALHVVTFIRRREVVAPLIMLLDDKAGEVRVIATATLMAYAPLYDLKPYVPKLIEMLKEDDEMIRFTATKVLNLVTGQALTDDYFVWKNWSEKR